MPGGVARYDEDWNPRAFGDNLTAWGTPVVLIESGGVPAGLDARRSHAAQLRRAARRARRGWRGDDLAGEDPAAYESLARNAERQFVDVLLAGGRVAQPPAPRPVPRPTWRSTCSTDDPPAAGCGPGAAAPSRIREVGDARLLGAGRRVDAAGRLRRAGIHRFAAR